MEITIENSYALSQNDLRKDALAIVEAGYAAVDVESVIRKKIRVADGQLLICETPYPLANRNVYFVGVGKCAIRGGRLLESLLGEALTGGIMLDVSKDDSGSISKMETFVGTHPLPTDINVQASQRILQFLSGRSENDLVIMLISGGGSALLSLPMAPMTCADEGTLFNQLTSRAAPIQDLNIVRKHLSLVRGGALAAAAYPAEVVSLIVSDVPGDAIASIASGPTVLDASTQDDAHAVLERYGITPPTGTTFIETPKDEKYFTRVTNTLFLSSRDALAGMLSEAVQRGYATTVCDSEFAGEARDIGRAIVEKLHNSPSKTALLYAGESTVTLSGSTAKGGRNQEMALSALESVQADELVVPFASDGCDNTDHAGAISDEITLTHIRDSSLSISEYLDEHRSYDFFVQTGDALITGPTGSNVADLVVALKA